MFSAILLAVILMVVVFGGAYLWWKTRGLRKLMRNFRLMARHERGDAFAGEVFKGEVIEGEVTRVDGFPAKGAGIDSDQIKRQSR